MANSDEPQPETFRVGADVRLSFQSSQRTVGQTINLLVHFLARRQPGEHRFLCEGKDGQKRLAGRARLIPVESRARKRKLCRTVLSKDNLKQLQGPDPESGYRTR